MAGRKRTSTKLPIGVFEKEGRYYCRPTNALMREIFAARLPGKKLIPLGDDERKMREQWKLYFRDDPLADGAPTGTVAEIITRYEREVLPDVPKSTRTTEEYWLPNLLERFGRMKYARSEFEAVRGDFLRRVHVQAYITECSKLRPVAVNREVSTLRKIFRYAQSWGLTEFNPCMEVRRNIESPRDTYISDGVLADIYGKAHPVLQCIIDIAQMFGCRPGEARGLREQDILEEGVLLTPLKGKRGQPNKPRVYTWTDELRAVIDRAKRLRAEILAKTGSDVYASGGEAADHLGHTDSRTTRRVYDRLPRRIAPVIPIRSQKKGAG